MEASTAAPRGASMARGRDESWSGVATTCRTVGGEMVAVVWDCALPPPHTRLWGLCCVVLCCVVVCWITTAPTRPRQGVWRGERCKHGWRGWWKETGDHNWHQETTVQSEGNGQEAHSATRPMSIPS
eukprot:scaffold1724_cov341-Pavlova_lutheri.AAC.6